MELVYLKDRMWCIYIHHRVWICYPNVVRRYGRGMSATCPLRAEMSHMWPCQEMRKHVVLPLTSIYTDILCCASVEFVSRRVDISVYRRLLTCKIPPICLNHF